MQQDCRQSISSCDEPEFDASSLDASPRQVRAEDELTDDHIKLMYLISRYSGPACGEMREIWVSKFALLVLAYEGVVAGVFDYDFAPTSMMMGNRRVFLNISQEGNDDLEDLWEAGFIRALKMSCSEHQSVTAFRVSKKGLAVTLRATPEMRAAVDEVILAPGTRDLVSVNWDAEEAVFRLQHPSGYTRTSTITDCEDVSYCSSPYLPASLRRSRRPTRSFAHRAHECAEGVSNIRDELDEAVVLSNVKVLMADWIPTGANQIVSLNDKLGALERVQGGFFTSETLNDITAPQFEFERGLTSVSVLDFSLTRFLNIEAEVFFKEDAGIVQIENFGIHVHKVGNIMCGLKLDAIMNRSADDVSIDLLARVLTDVQQDSSRILNSLISSYQRSLLELVFCGDALNRAKFNMIIADRLNPQMKAKQYMDRERFENELKQVLGDIHSAFDLDSDTILLLGSNGGLLAGPGAVHYEAALIPFVSMNALRIFVHQYFGRVFMLSADLQKIRVEIENHEKDPNSIYRIRHMLSQTSRQVILVEEVRDALADAVDALDPATAARGKSRRRSMRRKRGSEDERRADGAPDHEAEAKAQEVFAEIYDIRAEHGDLHERVDDLRKRVKALGHELQSLRELADVLSESRNFRLQEEACANTRGLQDMFRANERASSSLEVMQVILSGTLAFEIVDRITGEWSILDTWWGEAYILRPLIQVPGLWFVLNLALWGAIAYALVSFMNSLTEGSAAVRTERLKVNRKINLEKLDVYLRSKPISEEDLDANMTMRLKKVTWEEEDASRWRGFPPTIELQYDQTNGFLLTVFFQQQKGGRTYSAASPMSPRELQTRFFHELAEAGVLPAEPGGGDHERHGAKEAPTPSSPFPRPPVAFGDDSLSTLTTTVTDATTAPFPAIDAATLRQRASAP